MTSVDHLLGDADVAMYQAKALGKGRHQVFTGLPTASGDELTPNRGATSRVDPRTWLSRRPSVRRAGLRQASLGPEG